jgi:hypothetical protein
MALRDGIGLLRTPVGNPGLASRRAKHLRWGALSAEGHGPRLFREFYDMHFLTCTSGTLRDEPTARALGRLGNVAPAINVEDYREQTVRRRGRGCTPRRKGPWSGFRARQ